MDFGNKQVTKAIALEMERALQDVAAKHGLKITYAGGSIYSAGEFVGKFKVIAEGSETKEENSWKQLADLYGLKPEWLGKTFKSSQGFIFTVSGLKSGASKRCVQLKRNDGKIFVTSAEDLTRQMTRQGF